MTYSIGAYARMIGEPIRAKAYISALHETVGPGTVVADIGTGFGFFAVLACKLGAARVYAIEPDDVIELARKVAEENGCADRMTFVKDLSTRVELPEKVDVVVSDLRGVLPLFTTHITSLADARKRFLKPGGVLIPKRDTLCGAIVSLPEAYTSHVEPWRSIVSEVQLSSVRQVLTSSWAKKRIESKDLLSNEKEIATLEYGVREDSNLDSTVGWTCTRDGVAHGIGAWFDATLTDAVKFSNGPASPEALYGNAFFPFQQPVSITTGDVLTVTLRAAFVQQDYIWQWQTRVESRGVTIAQFEQSNQAATLVSPEKLRARRDDHIPKSSKKSDIARKILDLVDNNRSSGEIARELAASFPGEFADWQRALTSVADIVDKLS